MNRQFFYFYVLVLYLLSILVSTSQASQKKQPIIPDDFYLKIKDTASYVIGPGDELKLFFMLSGKDSSSSYQVQIGDEFEVNFYLNSELDKTVKVLPDSSIVMAPVGSINAAGHTIKQLADTIKNRFSSTLANPLVVVKPQKLYQTSAQLISSLTPTTPQGLALSVTPDGNLVLPYCSKFKAEGLTYEQLEDTISNMYSSLYPGIKVSAVLNHTINNNVFILGEINKPGSYDLNETRTLLALMSKSQVDPNTAGLRSVLVMSKDNQGLQCTHVIDVKRILKKGEVKSDLRLKQGDIVYVPKKPIAKAGLFVKQYINDMIPQIFRLGWTIGIFTNR